MPIDEIDSLRAWLLARLRDELVRSRPGFVAAFENASGVDHSRRLEEGWDDLLGDPIKLWPELLTALDDIEVAVEHVKFAVQGLASA